MIKQKNKYFTPIIRNNNKKINKKKNKLIKN